MDTPQPIRQMRRKAWGPRLLIFSGLVLLIGTLGWYAILTPLRNPKPLPIPGRLAGLPLTRHAFGRPAADEIARLHDSRFPLTGATVAEYGDGAAIVWASQTWGRWGAQYLVRSMTKAIEDSTSPFTPTGQRTMAGHKVYALTGMGMSHFYFRFGNQVVWLGVAPGRAEEALRDLLAYLDGTLY